MYLNQDLEIQRHGLPLILMPSLLSSSLHIFIRLSRISACIQIKFRIKKIGELICILHGVETIVTIKFIITY